MNKPHRYKGSNNDTVTAAYNFVPLSKLVVPSVMADIENDCPLEKGISGTIDLSILAKTPLSIGSEKTKATDKEAGKSAFFKTPGENGQYAIPGTSIKGMVRNIFEIATFSKMSMVENKRLGIRDLKFNSYQSRFSTTKGTKIKTAWLKFESNLKQWSITPCSYTKIKYQEISNLLPTKKYWPPKNHKGHDNLKSNQKYDFWNKHIHSLKISKPVYDKKGKEVSKHGYLVVTGAMKNKKSEFLFEPPQIKKLSGEKVQNLVSDFLSVYRETPEYINLNKLDKSGKLPGIPVFYIEEEGAIHSLGLSGLYKLGADYSIHDLISNTSKEHFTSQVDFTTSLFGEVNENNVASKGRVSFSLYKTDNKHASWQEEVILSSPRPSYYPSYIKQPLKQNNNKIQNVNYLSYLQAKSVQEKPTIRGWKRYPISSNNTPKQQFDKKSTVTKLQTMPKGTRFKGKIRVHNIHEIELGALLWSLTFGSREGAFHQLGAGKSLGFGQVKIELNTGALNGLTANNRAEVLNANEYIKKFESYMESQVSDWKETPQIKSLVGMANKSDVNTFITKAKTKLLPISIPKKFADLKGTKKIPGHVLPDFSEYM